MDIFYVDGVIYPYLYFVRILSEKSILLGSTDCLVSCNYCNEMARREKYGIVRDRLS